MSTRDHEVEDVLKEAGDHAGAFLWRRVCRDLDGSLRVGVVARDGQAADRLVEQMRGVSKALEWVPLTMDFDDEDPAPSYAAEDRLLSVHALVWATPMNAALGQEERQALSALESAGCPERRAVVLAGEQLLARMSDNPDAEREEIRARLDRIVPKDWSVVEEAELAAWLANSESARLGLARDRRRDVARLLLHDARDQSHEALERLKDEVVTIDALLAKEDKTLEEARKRGDRTAAHMVGAIRRHTEQLVVDLREFLLRLEQRIPEEVEAVPDLDIIRRTLPHWLNHVVEGWMRDRLAQWRREVTADLEAVLVAAEHREEAELLPPSLHPPPLGGDGQWGYRLAVTAALGSGAALLMVGLWIPAALAVSGSVIWSAFRGAGREAKTRARLIDAGVEAVRKMGQDAERVLNEQIAALEGQLDDLGDNQAAEVAETRASARSQLETQRLVVETRLGELQGMHDQLLARIQGLQLD